jgi:hypothetical protein
MKPTGHAAVSLQKARENAASFDRPGDFVRNSYWVRRRAAQGEALLPARAMLPISRLHLSAVNGTTSNLLCPGHDRFGTILPRNRQAASLSSTAVSHGSL